MKKLDRYLLREFFKLFSLNLGMLCALYLVVDFFEKVDQFILKQASLSEISRYFFYKFPLIIFQITPLAVLLATILTLSILVRNNEIVPLKAGGVSLFRLSLPFLFSGIFISLFIFGWNEYIVPPSIRQANYIYRIKIKKEKEDSLRQRNNLWFRGQDNLIWNISFLDPEAENILRGISVYRLKPGKGISERIDAQWAEWKEGNWEFNRVYLRNFEKEKEVKFRYFPRKYFSSGETIEDFKRIKPKPEEMNFRELKNFINNLKAEGFDPTKYQVDFFYKFSFPLINFIMVLLGIPFSLSTNRSGGLSLGIGLSLLIAFSLWMILSFGVSLGHAGALPPFLAAWGTNIVFLALGFYLILTVD